MKLIDKDAVVAEIERRIKQFVKENNTLLKNSDNAKELRSRIIMCKEILSFIDTLEVKEVDLDFQRFAKEMDAIFALPFSETKNTEENPLNWEYAIAKHFYSLGLAQKGEEA